jgi:hypothetical protein
MHLITSKNFAGAVKQRRKRQQLACTDKVANIPIYSIPCFDVAQEISGGEGAG